MPIAYIQRTRERYAEYPPFKWIANHDAPWTALTKPLTACRLALISSGGFYTKEQASFTENDRFTSSCIPLRRMMQTAVYVSS